MSEEPDLAARLHGTAGPPSEPAPRASAEPAAQPSVDAMRSGPSTAGRPAESGPSAELGTLAEPGPDGHGAHVPPAGTGGHAHRAAGAAADTAGGVVGRVGDAIRQRPVLLLAAVAAGFVIGRLVKHAVRRR